MTTRTSTVKDTFASDAELRTLAQSIHDHFSAAGFVQTADTGQINLSTATRVSNASSGYEIWRFADTLQATAPIYFKIEYGTGPNGVTTPSFWLTVGSGSDGAGAITATLLPNGGTTTVRRVLVTTGTVAGSGASWTSYFHYGAADGSGFAWCQWLAASSTTSMGGFVCAIERFRSADGTTNGDGFNVFNSTGNAVSAAASFFDGRFFATGVVQPTVGVAGWQAPTGLVVPTASASSALTATILYPVPVFTGMAPRLAGPSQYFLLVGRSDLGVGALLTFSHYGTSRNWLALGPTGVVGGWGSVDVAAQMKSMVMRND